MEIFGTDIKGAIMSTDNLKNKGSTNRLSDIKSIYLNAQHNTFITKDNTHSVMKKAVVNYLGNMAGITNTSSDAKRMLSSRLDGDIYESEKPFLKEMSEHLVDQARKSLDERENFALQSTDKTDSKDSTQKINNINSEKTEIKDSGLSINFNKTSSDKVKNNHTSLASTSPSNLGEGNKITALNKDENRSLENSTTTISIDDISNTTSDKDKFINSKV